MQSDMRKYQVFFLHFSSFLRDKGSIKLLHAPVKQLEHNCQNWRKKGRRQAEKNKLAALQNKRKDFRIDVLGKCEEARRSY